MFVPATRRSRGAFTLIELIVIIVVLAILSGAAIPRYYNHTTAAKAAAAKGTIGAVRSAISTFYLSSALTGTPTFPTLVQMQTLGTVMQEPMPTNPYNSSNAVAAGVWATTPPTAGAAGYHYDAANGHFWLNSTTVGENTW